MSNTRGDHNEEEKPTDEHTVELEAQPSHISMVINDEDEKELYPQSPPSPHSPESNAQNNNQHHQVEQHLSNLILNKLYWMFDSSFHAKKDAFSFIQEIILAVSGALMDYSPQGSALLSTISSMLISATSMAKNTHARTDIEELIKERDSNIEYLEKYLKNHPDNLKFDFETLFVNQHQNRGIIKAFVNNYGIEKTWLNRTLIFNITGNIVLLALISKDITKNSDEQAPYYALSAIIFNLCTQLFAHRLSAHNLHDKKHEVNSDLIIVKENIQQQLEAEIDDSQRENENLVDDVIALTLEKVIIAVARDSVKESLDIVSSEKDDLESKSRILENDVIALTLEIITLVLEKNAAEKNLNSAKSERDNLKIQNQQNEDDVIALTLQGMVTTIERDEAERNLKATQHALELSQKRLREAIQTIDSVHSELKAAIVEIQTQQRPANSSQSNLLHPPSRLSIFADRGESSTLEDKSEIPKEKKRGI